MGWTRQPTAEELQQLKSAVPGIVFVQELSGGARILFAAVASLEPPAAVLKSISLSRGVSTRVAIYPGSAAAPVPSPPTGPAMNPVPPLMPAPLSGDPPPGSSTANRYWEQDITTIHGCLDLSDEQMDRIKTKMDGQDTKLDDIQDRIFKQAKSGRRSPEDWRSPPKRKTEEHLRPTDNEPERRTVPMEDDQLGDVITLDCLPDSLTELLVGHVTKMVKRVDLQAVVPTANNTDAVARCQLTKSKKVDGGADPVYAHFVDRRKKARISISLVYSDISLATAIQEKMVAAHARAFLDQQSP